MERSTPLKNVFLDTAVFVEENFNFRSPRIRSLVSLASDDIVNVFLTDITVREIKANLKEQVSRAVQKRPDPILKNSSLPAVKRLFKSVDAEAVEKEFLSQFDRFMKDAGVTVLRVEADVLPDVLEDYFRRRPPFGPGKNKAEFPDALVLHVLRRRCKSKNDQMAVITRDKAVQTACDETDFLNHFESLAKYLDAVASDDRSKSEFVRQRVFQQREILFEKAKKRFPHMGFILTDLDGEVEDVELTAMEADGKVEIISLEDDWAEVEVPATFLFEASVSYDEPGTGIYDHEDESVYFPNVIQEKVRRKFHRSLDVEIVFKGLDPNSVEIGGVWFHGPDDIEVESDYYSDWTP